MGKRADKQSRCQIPVVDRWRRIVGWTSTPPDYVAGVLRHPEAEALLGSGVVAAYVQVDSPAEAMKAGAPSDWAGPWRCLGLCDPALSEPGPRDLAPPRRPLPGQLRGTASGPRPRSSHGG